MLKAQWQAWWEGQDRDRAQSFRDRQTHPNTPVAKKCGARSRDFVHIVNGHMKMAMTA